MRKTNAEYRAEYKARGLCVECCKAKARHGVRCELCRQKHNAREMARARCLGRAGRKFNKVSDESTKHVNQLLALAAKASPLRPTFSL